MAERGPRGDHGQQGERGPEGAPGKDGVMTAGELEIVSRMASTVQEQTTILDRLVTKLDRASWRDVVIVALLIALSINATLGYFARQDIVRTLDIVREATDPNSKLAKKGNVRTQKLLADFAHNLRCDFNADQNALIKAFDLPTNPQLDCNKPPGTLSTKQG